MHRTNFSRREFCVLSGSTIAALTVGSACGRIGGSVIVSDGRLTARPRTNVKTAATGEIKLGLDSERDAILQIPKNAGDSPLPLFVMLHGATQNADQMFWYLGSTHEEAGVAVLAPNSRDTTWDAITGNGFGVDVEYLNRALERVFETTAIDPARVSVGGFSDGASYGLSLGLINGALPQKGLNRTVCLKNQVDRSSALAVNPTLRQREEFRSSLPARSASVLLQRSVDLRRISETD